MLEPLFIQTTHTAGNLTPQSTAATLTGLEAVKLPFVRLLMLPLSSVSSENQKPGLNGNLLPFVTLQKGRKSFCSGGPLQALHKAAFRWFLHI